MYSPFKYFRGLSKTRKVARKAEIKKYGALDSKDPKAYVGFKTDKGVKTRKSSYTQEWKKLYPDVTSLKDKAAVTGVPLDLIEDCYNRGLAAWRTGHRPGSTQQQWGYARVSSMLLLGKTAITTDSDLVAKAKKRSAKARAWYAKTAKTSKVKFSP